MSELDTAGHARRRETLAIILVLACFGAAWITTGSGNRIEPDETFFAQVVHRVITGEVLYRDVSYMATPLAVYASAPVFAVLGPQLLAVRALYFLIFAATCLLAVRIARRVAPAVPAVLFVLALCVYARPIGLLPVYNPLAYLLLMAALAAILAWEAAGADAALAAAAAFAALSFATKQTIGASTLGAVLLSVAVAGRGRRIRAFAVVLAVFAGVTIAVIAPAVIAAGPAAFLHEIVGNKASYIKLQGVPYRIGLTSILSMLRHVSDESLASSSRLYWQMAYLLPPISLVALAVAVRKAGGKERLRMWIMAAFCAASLVPLYPLADMYHVTVAMPAALLALAAALDCSCVAGRLPRATRAGISAWLAIGAGYLLLNPPISLILGRYAWSDLPYTRGALVDQRQLADLRESTAALRKYASQYGPVFLATPYASTFYLTAGLKNPTSVDYVMAVFYTEQEQQQLARSFIAGNRGSVCFDTVHVPGTYYDPLRPLEFEQLVRRNMVPAGRAGFCEVYRPKSPATSSGAGSSRSRY